MSNYLGILSIFKIKNKLICNKRCVTKVTIIWMELGGFRFLYKLKTGKQVALHFDTDA
jgi:hypothetical protein